MPGFTPINASVPAQHVAATDSEPPVTRASRSSARQVTQDLIVSQLEQSHDDNAQTSRKPRKIPGKGKKRPRKDSNNAASKRRKSGDVSESMTVTKPGASSTKAAAKKPAGRRRSSTDRAPVQSICDDDINGDLEDALFDDLDLAPRVVQHDTRPVTVYAHPTTMGPSHSYQTRTTMQQVSSAPLGTASIYTSADASPYTSSSLCRTNAGPTRHGGKFLTPPGSESDLMRESRSLAVTAQSHASNASVSPQSLANASSPSVADEITAAIVLSEDDFEEFEEPAVRSVYAIETVKAATPPPRDRALNKREVHEHESYGGALFSQSEKQLLDSLKSKTSDHAPLVRTPFPSSILDRSPLFGVTNAVTLRTCFRVGEAVNAGCQAVRMNKNVILELYARVTSSWREAKPSRKQVFTVHDLYLDHPPHLEGTFDLWDQSTLWELDSQPFLSAGSEGMLARIIARMKRDGMKWRLEILNVWQADWDDVEHVAGIYAKSEGLLGDE